MKINVTVGEGELFEVIEVDAEDLTCPVATKSLSLNILEVLDRADKYERREYPEMRNHD